MRVGWGNKPRLFWNTKKNGLIPSDAMLGTIAALARAGMNAAETRLEIRSQLMVARLALEADMEYLENYDMSGSVLD